MPKLTKEVWIKQLMENFYPETSFLNYVKDLTALVNNDKINLASAGLDPQVYINNENYPISIVKRNDTPLEIEMKKFETENSEVVRPDVIEYAYDQLESVILGHRNSLRTQTARLAAHTFAPQENTANTPVLATTGSDDGEGNKRLRVEDIFLLKRKYDDMDYPFDNRFLVLTPKHVEDLMLADLDTFKDIMDVSNGQPKRFAGFNMLQFTKPPIYVRSTMTKKSFGATITGNDGFASFSFYTDEVMKADGDVYMYIRKDDPERRATIVGFDKRFVAMPFRNRGIGAIVSAAAV